MKIYVITKRCGTDMGFPTAFDTYEKAFQYMKEALEIDLTEYIDVGETLIPRININGETEYDRIEEDGDVEECFASIGKAAIYAHDDYVDWEIHLTEVQ
jgi:hypothetical protein